MQKSEKDLIFQDLILKYQNLVYKICVNMIKDKEESLNILQDSFLAFYKRIDKYIDLNENEIKNIICKIALNNCKDYLKKYMYKLKIESIDAYETDIREEENVTGNLVKEEEKEIVHNYINQLKSPYKEVLFEYYIKEKSLDEVSKTLNIPKETLKVQVYRAKQKLKEKIGGELNE